MANLICTSMAKERTPVWAGCPTVRRHDTYGSHYAFCGELLALTPLAHPEPKESATTPLKNDPTPTPPKKLPPTPESTTTTTTPRSTHTRSPTIKDAILAGRKTSKAMFSNLESDAETISSDEGRTTASSRIVRRF